MPRPAPPPSPSSTRLRTETAPVALQRPSRLQLTWLWAVSGWPDPEFRSARFAVLLVRPPICSDSSPPVAVEVIAPPRTRSGAVAAVASAGACIVGAAIAVSTMPVAVAICVITVAFVIAIRFIERARVAFAIPAGHVRLQDVVAERRGTGVGEAVLAELLSRIWRPVVVEVDSAATGLVEMYHRLGFRPASETTAPGGKLAMTRPASPTAELVDESLAGPFACWFWPSSGDITIGVAGAAAVGLAGASLDRFDQLVAVATAFVAASVASTDWRTRRIPNVLTAGGAVMLVALGVTTGDLGTAAGGALLMAGPLLASNLATGGRTPGLGDVKLAAVVGAGVAVVASLDAVLPTLTIALAVGAVFGAIYVRRSRRPGFPLGPPIAAATALTLAVAGLNHGGAL